MNDKTWVFIGNLNYQDNSIFKLTLIFKKDYLEQSFIIPQLSFVTRPRMHIKIFQMHFPSGVYLLFTIVIKNSTFNIALIRLVSFVKNEYKGSSIIENRYVRKLDILWQLIFVYQLFIYISILKFIQNTINVLESILCSDICNKKFNLYAKKIYEKA